METLFWILGFILLFGLSMYDREAGGFRQSFGTAVWAIIAMFVFGSLIVLFS